MTLWTAAHQAPLSKGFSRQEYWNRLPCSPPGDLPDPGIDPASLMSLALAGEFFTTWEAQRCWIYKQIGLTCKKVKWLSEKALQVAEKRRDAKGKGKRERYTHSNAEFQKTAKRDKKALGTDQCK